MEGLKAWFQCIQGCEGRHELNEIIYRCPKCDSLLEVCHDFERLKERPGQEWKEVFERRYRRSDWPYGSSVWGKKEVVCPNVDNENVVSTYEGGSNLFWAERFGKEIGLDDLWIKQCGNNHTGSFKDLGMTVLVSMVKQMISEGTDILAVACASTGDTSASLAAYCAVAGLQAIVFLPRNKVSTAQLIQPLAHGALTLSLDTDFDGCMEIVQEVCSKNKIYLANSMNSLRIEGQKTISMELVQQFEWEVPDYIIIPGGNLGNVSALGKGFSLMKDLGMINKFPRIVCAQAEAANPLYLSYLNGFKEFHPVKAKTTLANAIQIGNPVSCQKAIKVLKEFNGIVEQASEDELANAAAWADRNGLFNCPHTGVALAALIKLAKRGEIPRNARVIVISTANGLKFTDFQVGYHQGTLAGVKSLHANQPVDVAANYTSVRDAILRAVDSRK
ncbi:MAG: threonine synthase [Nitrospinae bacterium]|nr:threonine synthase [Nitrospinota bacterium]